MPRALPEWKGRTDDSAIPEKVQLRVLERQRNADRLPICPDCGQPIRPGQTIHFDHLVPLADGGAHAEGNLQAIHERPCHRIKTAREALRRAEARAQVKAVYGIKKKSPRPLAGTRASGIRRRMNGNVEKWK